MQLGSSRVRVYNPGSLAPESSHWTITLYHFPASLLPLCPLQWIVAKENYPWTLPIPTEFVFSSWLMILSKVTAMAGVIGCTYGSLVVIGAANNELHCPLGWVTSQGGGWGKSMNCCETEVLERWSWAYGISHPLFRASRPVLPLSVPLRKRRMQGRYLECRLCIHCWGSVPCP